MNVVCAGINHHIASVEIRERLAVAAHDMAGALDALREIPGVDEAVVVSTCNRVEVYAATRRPKETLAGLRAHLDARAGTGAPWIHLEGAASARHLFRVASGLDSMVLGETEILGQVKQAYQLATDAGATSRHLNRLFQTAFRVAKSVRTETRIGRGATSVGAVAVELAGQILGDLRHRRVMVLGAGETSERTARTLVSRGVRTVIVSNRTFARAAAIAEEIGGTAIHFDDWQKEFPDVDILISSTAAPRHLVTCDRLEPMMRERAGRPLFVIDLAVPRDVEPAVARLPGVHVYDIDSLETIARQSLEGRQREVSRGEKIIDAHVAEFMNWLHQPQPSLAA